MASMTDPARELGEIAKRLSKGNDAKGAQFLANRFGVAPWSTSFYKIIACILERAEQVATIVQRSEMDEDHIRDAIEHLEGFQSAFAGSALTQNWNTAGNGATLMRDHGQPIQFMAPTVRKFVAYPRLSDEEITELLALIDRYRDEVAKASDAPPFVRQAILDGLDKFRFQLENIGWMGAGYALSAFRQLFEVYDAVQNQDLPDAFDAQAFLGGFKSILMTFKKAVDAAQSWADTGGSVVKAYQLASSAYPIFLTAQHLLPGPR